MKKRYLILLLFLLPIFSIKAQVRYDIETVVVSDSNITMTGWAFKLDHDHCAASGMRILDQNIPYHYDKTNGMARCSFNLNQPVYEFAIVDVESGQVISTATGTRNGNSMTCSFYTTHFRHPKTPESCYYNFATGVDNFMVITYDTFAIRNTNIENNGNDYYYDGVGWNVVLPTTGIENGKTYKIQLSVFGETTDIGFQKDKISGDTSKFTFNNIDSTVNVVTVGWVGTLGEDGKISLKGDGGRYQFSIGVYGYTKSISSGQNKSNIVYGNQKYTFKKLYNISSCYTVHSFSSVLYERLVHYNKRVLW